MILVEEEENENCYAFLVAAGCLLMVARKVWLNLGVSQECVFLSALRKGMNCLIETSWESPESSGSGMARCCTDLSIACNFEATMGLRN